MPPSDLEEFGGGGAARYLPPRVTSLTFIIWPSVTVHRMGPSRVCLTKGVSEGLCWVGPTYRLSHPNPPAHLAVSVWGDVLHQPKNTSSRTFP